MPELSRYYRDENSDNRERAEASPRRHVEAVLEKELAQEAERTSESERQDVKEVARELKEHAIAEISLAERRENSRRKLARTYEFVDYFFYVAYALIGLLIALELIGARDRSGFMRFLHTITAPLVAPFKGVMPDPSVGSFQLMISYVIALIVYLMLHGGLKKLFEILAHRKPAST